MSANALPPRLYEILLKHLQDEEGVLHRLQGLARNFNDGGYQSLSRVENQAELSGLLQDSLQLHQNRQGIRQAISQWMQCEPGSVRLSRLTLNSPAAEAELKQRREHLSQLAIESQATWKTIEESFRGWSGIVGFVLGELLDSSNTSDRYGANGQRVAVTRICSIDMRS
ncbi:hypothetical protein SH661x_000537 [Planctomicrobium sp. SH661]|uniref:hypothetical protein n=1 Tax=Planctomicrobium sp. SH661 TaxID=3448124 RepID=UPI003F5B9C57